MVMIANALRDEVDTVVIMPSQNSVAFQRKCEACEVDYVTFPISRLTREFSVALRYVFCFVYEVFLISRYLRKEDFDLVHISGGSWQYKGVIAANLAGIKSLWHLNDTNSPNFVLRVFGILSGLADGFVFSSQRTKQYYSPLLNSRVPASVILPPVDAERFTRAKGLNLINSYMQRWEGKLVIGTVCNINPVKGLETLIHAAALVNEALENVQFIIVGPVYSRQQRYFETLELLCQESGIHNIEFVGGEEDVRGYLSLIDIYVCSSVSEAGPMSLWEAMAMECAIVSTNVGDVSLLIEDGVDGFIVDVGDNKNLADRLVQLAEDRTKRKEFGENARALTLREIHVSSCAAKHLQAYSSLVIPS